MKELEKLQKPFDASLEALAREVEFAKSIGITVRQDTKEFKDNADAIMQAQGVSLQQAKAIEILRIADL